MKTKVKNLLIVILCSLLFFAIILLAFKSFFQVNDDLAIQKLISGQYNGESSIHGIYMIFPLTLVLKILYKICNFVNWYALLLVGCEMAFYIIAMYKIIGKLKNTTTKIITLVGSMSLILLFFNTYLRYITYTEVAIFIMLCVLIVYLLSEGSKTDNFIIFIGTIIAFTMRMNACIMMLPLFIPIGIYKTYKNKEKIKKQLLLGFTILGSIIVIVISNNLIDYYSGWSEYNKFNTIRNKLTDYYLKEITKLPEEEQNNLYERAGIDAEERKLLKLYYYGLDDTLEEKIQLLTKYYEEGYNKNAINNISTTIQELIKQYKKEMITIAVLIIINLCLILYYKDKKTAILWLGAVIYFICIIGYLVYEGKIVARVMRPFLFSQICMFLAIILLNSKVFTLYEEIMAKKILGISFTILVTFINICIIINTKLEKIPLENYILTEENQYNYYKEHKENFYIQDVDDWDNGEKRISYILDNSEQNYMSLGDWIAYSPAYYKKLNNMNAENMLELCLKDNVYIVAVDKRHIEYSEIWKKNNNLKIEIVDKIEKYFNQYNVYKVSRIN